MIATTFIAIDNSLRGAAQASEPSCPERGRPQWSFCEAQTREDPPF